MFNQLIGGASILEQATSENLSLPFQALAALMLNSLAMGVLLAAITFIAVRSIWGKQNMSSSRELFKLLIGSSNLLFLCVGMTGITLLINNNIVRAFAIIAALALVRFRVKLDQKNINASILFSVLVGTACGLQEVQIAWLMLGFYVVLLGALIILLTVFKISPATDSSILLNPPPLPGPLVAPQAVTSIPMESDNNQAPKPAPLTI